MKPATNVHGTAIVVGTTGLIFVGPSGCGKSATALHCIGRAREHGLFAALVADDQVFVTPASGGLVARSPQSIAGLAEVRGFGIIGVETISGALLHRAVRPIRAPFTERLAPEAEEIEVVPGYRLPVKRLPIEDGFDCFARLTLILPRLLEN